MSEHIAVDRPADMDDAAKAVWERVVSTAADAGVVSTAADTLRRYCEAVARYERSARLLAASGPLVQRAGHLVQNPLHAVVRDEAAQVRAIAKELRALGLKVSSTGSAIAGVFDPRWHCGARRRSDDVKGPGRIGDRCRRTKGWGTDHRGSGHCRLHGGTSPGGGIAAAEERAEMHLARLGMEVKEVASRRELARVLNFSAAEIARTTEAWADAVDAADPFLAAQLSKHWSSLLVRHAHLAKLNADVQVDERRVANEERWVAADIDRMLVGIVSSLDVQAANTAIDPAFLARIQPASAQDAFRDEVHSARTRGYLAAKAHTVAWIAAMASGATQPAGVQ